MHRADYLAEGNIRRQILWIFTLTTCLAIYCLNTVTLHKKGPEKVKILVSKRIWAINHLPEAWICKYISELKDKISKPQGRREIRRIPLGWICGIDPCQMQLRLSINFCLKKKVIYISGSEWSSTGWTKRKFFGTEIQTQRHWYNPCPNQGSHGWP